MSQLWNIISSSPKSKNVLKVYKTKAIKAAKQIKVLVQDNNKNAKQLH